MIVCLQIITNVIVHGCVNKNRTGKITNLFMLIKSINCKRTNNKNNKKDYLQLCIWLRRGFKDRCTVPGVCPPPSKIFPRLGFSGISIHLHNDKCAHISVNSYVTTIFLPLISDFIHIIFCLSGLLNLTESFRACTLTFFKQLGIIYIISLFYIEHSGCGYA